MKYLRYLDLSDNDIKTLPSSITKLQNLQTLKLSDCQDLEELPKDIRKLVSLRHLELDFCNGLTGMPCGLGKLASLRTLTLFITGPGSRLSELKGLNHLQGKLKIELRSGQWCLRSSNSEVAEAVLKEKAYLWSLELNFRSYDNDDELVLEGLQPHQNLKKLDIRWYGGVSFPTWMKVNIDLFLPNLVSITLLSCYGWKHLPQFRQLPSLRALELSCLNSLRHIDENSNNSGGDGGGGRESRTTFFPSLKYLSLIDLPNLKGWWSKEEPTIMEMETASFPCLSRSYIRNCPKLASMPLQPSSVELKLDGVSAKLIQQQLSMMMMATPTTPMITTVDILAPSSSSFSPLPKLAVLYINDIEDLVFLPDKAFQSLISLGKLWISNCPRLTSLPRGMRYLNALESLRIHNCQELNLLDDDDDDDGMPFLGLKNLTSLEISQIPKLVFLPAGLRHLTSLQSLSISRCENLATLQQMGNLTSLPELSISSCEKLTTLRQIGKLTSLQKLSISRCEKLTTLQQVGNLTSLRELSISSCEKLATLRQIGKLTSLQKLSISRREKLTTLRQVGNLTSLRELSISSCGKLTTLQQIGKLTSLQKLSISRCEKLTTLQQVGNLTSLQELSISRCENLMTLWQIGNPTSLEQFSISFCPRLTSLPETMHRLTALRLLKIENCSKVLCDRCNKETGED